MTGWWKLAEKEMMLVGVMERETKRTMCGLLDDSMTDVGMNFVWMALVVDPRIDVEIMPSGHICMRLHIGQRLSSSVRLVLLACIA